MKLIPKNIIKTFSSSQRKGIVSLVILVVLLQVSIFLYNNQNSSLDANQFNQASVNYYQNKIDSLKELNKKPKIFPFNPNFIDDTKGYRLGMTVEEIDKLLNFRKTDQYVNSAKDFQKVTGVSDAWLEENSPYFKFPEWTQKSNSSSNNSNYSNSDNVPIKDINKATTADLILIKGIGPAYADRIIKERDKLGGFVHINQIDFVWGLPPEVFEPVKKKFKIVNKPHIQKININKASKEDVLKIPYINNQVAREILILRSKSDNPLNIEDMKKIKGFPLDKLNIIALYLDF